MRATYFGHSAFRFDIGDSVVLIDPFLSGNPHFKGDVAEATEGATHILLSHGHADHVGDTVEIAGRTKAKVVCAVELGAWLAKKGVENVVRANTGGTVSYDDFSVTLTQAFHTSSQTGEDGLPVYTGMPNGLVVAFSGGPTVYHMGDTAIFGDMALINELYEPSIGLVPMGGHFTMDSKTAALACKRFFSFDKIVPIHWGTMPVLAPTPAAFVEAMGDAADSVIQPEVGAGFEI